jgi:glutamyl-tRNA reductase
MQIIQVGLSHKTEPVEIREQLALSETGVPAALRALRLGSNDSNGKSLTCLCWAAVIVSCLGRE